jgi:hypothetical protein
MFLGIFITRRARLRYNLSRPSAPCRPVKPYSNIMWRVSNSGQNGYSGRNRF